MASKLLGLVGVVLFISAVNANADLDVSQIEGKWYQSAVAASNPKYTIHSVWMTKASVGFLTANKNGDLHVNVSLIMGEDTDNPTCLKMSNFLKKTKIPGKYIVYSSDLQTLNDLYILDVDYNEFIIAQNKWNNADGTDIVNKLFTRKPEVSHELRKKFMNLSKSAGQIVFLPVKGECA